MSEPLAGVKILDFSQNLPGPYATFLLACWGAEVVKVEPPKGDPARHMEPFFSIVNRGKKSVVIDLREESGKASLEKLIAWCDVLVEGFRPGVLERLGGGYERAREINPKIVYCSISAFGQHGPLRDHPGHDLNLQSLAGVCHLERDADGVPGYSMLPIADLSSALLAVSSICAALHAGQARYLDVAMADGVLSWSSVWGTGVDLKTNAQRQLKGGPIVDVILGPLLDHLGRLKLYAMPHYGVFETKDRKYLTIGIVDENHFWKSLCDELGLGGFSKLPMGARIAAGPALRPVIARRIKSRPLADWLSRFARASVPVSAVLTPEEAARDAQVVARNLVDDRGWIGSPLPGARLPSGDPPKLGEHTEEVLGARGEPTRG